MNSTLNSRIRAKLNFKLNCKDLTCDGRGRAQSNAINNLTYFDRGDFNQYS